MPLTKFTMQVLIAIPIGLLKDLCLREAEFCPMGLVKSKNSKIYPCNTGWKKSLSISMTDKNYWEIKLIYPYIFLKCLFIFERERESVCTQVGERQRERRTPNPKQAPGSELSALVI